MTISSNKKGRIYLHLPAKKKMQRHPAFYLNLLYKFFRSVYSTGGITMPSEIS